jgi:SMODS-associating 2TM, beta-strand rich effector domain
VHPYSTDASRPIRVMFFLAIGAAGLAYALNWVLTAFHVSPPWWLDTPAALGFYGICWRLYDRRLWRLGRGNQTLSGVPNLGGTWTGTVFSNYGNGMQLKATLVVRQTSSRILIELHTSTSHSHSTMAAVCAEPGPQHGLRYTFMNQPRPLTEQTMFVHGGIAHLTWSADGAELTGDYETGRFRGSHGRLEFTRDRDEQPTKPKGGDRAHSV